MTDEIHCRVRITTVREYTLTARADPGGPGSPARPVTRVLADEIKGLENAAHPTTILSLHSGYGHVVAADRGRSTVEVLPSSPVQESPTMADPTLPLAVRPSPIIHPFCHKCGWRKGGVNSWDGNACKCGHHEPPLQYCTTCAGNGRLVDRQPCPHCDGSGLVRTIARAT